MSNTNAMVKPPEVTISAIIKRKDGTIEDLGVIANSKNGSIKTSNILSYLKGMVNRNG
jgi:hypothetical protein